MDRKIAAKNKISKRPEVKKETTSSSLTVKKENESKEVYLPGKSRDLKKDEELICDESAYIMHHKFETVHPCLSFDTLPDEYGGAKRDQYPATCLIVAGTQAEKIRDNSIIVMKLTNLSGRKQKEKENEDDKDDEESSDSDSDDGDEEPNMFSSAIKHHGGINRIRATTLNHSPICAVWNDQAKVQIWSLAECIKSVESLRSDNEFSNVDEKPLFTFAGHLSEGYALDWSLANPGKLASGDNRKNIHVWTMAEGGKWVVDQRPFNAHASSVEDVQWSPSEDNVFASCSSDKSIKLWDSRVSPLQACVCSVDQAHERDVNVISWNSKEPLLVSGGDDCALKVWDLKFIKNNRPVAAFKHHSKPITSVHWYVHDSTVFSAASADNQVTIWDLSVEPDDEMEVKDTSEKCDVAPQLMFIHSGQDEIKEVRWHPQLCGTLISTALDGFSIFRPMNF